MTRKSVCAPCRFAVAAAFVGTAASVLGFVESCDNRLVNLTRYFDPCGTILGNCFPGDILTNNAEVADYCIDPACTVPGRCGPGQALGTLTDLCP